MSGSGKGLLGLWLYRSGEQEWAVKEGSPLHRRRDFAKKEPSGNSSSPGDRTSIMFTLKNQVGGLARALQVFQELGINVLHIELQNKDAVKEQADVLVDIECDSKHLDHVIRMLKREVQSVNQINQTSEEFPPPTPLSACTSFGEWNFPISLGFLKKPTFHLNFLNLFKTAVLRYFTRDLQSKETRLTNQFV